MSGQDPVMHADVRLVFRFKGRFYINNVDEYDFNGSPSDLGDLFVGGLPVDESQTIFHWLDILAEQCSIFEYKSDARVKTVPLKEMEDLQYWGGRGTPALDPLPYGFMEYMPSPFFILDNKEEVEPDWIYIFDLDHGSFSVRTQEAALHFDLVHGGDHFFKCWPSKADNVSTFAGLVNHLSSFGLVKGDPTLAPNLFPLRAGTPDLDAISRYDALVVSKVSPLKLQSFPMGKRSAVSFARRLFQAMILDTATPYWRYLPNWDTNDVGFQETAFAILCLASGSSKYLSFVNMSRLTGRMNNELVGISYDGGRCADEAISGIMMGYHFEGKEANISPQRNEYWFEGVLVCLWRRLNDISEAKASVAHAVKIGNEQGKEDFHAIIMSIEHVILLQVFPGSRVHHTSVLVLSGKNGPKDIKREVASTSTGPESEGKETPQLTKVSGVNQFGTKRPSSFVSDGEIQGDLSDIGLSSQTRNDRTGLERSSDLSVDAREDAFVAISHLLEAARLKSLRPGKPDLPPEILSNILRFTDNPTRACCASASKDLYFQCQLFCAFAEPSVMLHDDGESCYLYGVDSEANVRHDLIEVSPWDYVSRFFPPCRQPRPPQGDRGKFWLPIVGDGSQTRSFLPDIMFTFDRYNPSDHSFIAQLQP